MSVLCQVVKRRRGRSVVSVLRVRVGSVAVFRCSFWLAETRIVCYSCVSWRNVSSFWRQWLATWLHEREQWI